MFFLPIMGILNQPYINNTLGDRSSFRAAGLYLINHEDKFGIIGDEYLLILKQDNMKALYKYRNKDKKDYKNEQQELVREMENIIYQNLQVFQYLIQNETAVY